ncbi:MAG TPA: hypothetical protein VGA53_03755 [Candidatus Paceibacterota bacterium]
MNEEKSFPITADGWVKLGSVLGDKVIVHAVSIKKKDKRPTSPHGNHRVDEAFAQGSVEITSRFFQEEFDISKFKG